MYVCIILYIYIYIYYISLYVGILWMLIPLYQVCMVFDLGMFCTDDGGGFLPDIELST